MKTFQKLILFAVGLILLASNAQAGRWLTRDPMDIPAHMELDPHPFFDGNPYTFVGNNPVNNVDPYGLWIWFGWFRSQPSQPAQPSNPNSYGAMRAAMIGDPSDNNFNGKTGAQVATDIGMAVPKGILNTAAAMLGPGEAEGAYAAADEALQAARAAKAAKAASKCEKIVSGHSKPATEGRMKTSHFEGSIACWAAWAAHGRNERTQCELAAYDINFGGQWLVQPAHCA
jgi:hypothetical protein